MVCREIISTSYVSHGALVRKLLLSPLRFCAGNLVVLMMGLAAEIVDRLSNLVVTTKSLVGDSGHAHSFTLVRMPRVL